MKKQKTLPKLKAELQLLLNAWIRKRDEGQPCISCGQFKPDMQAGHFFAVGGFDGLRFNEDNCHLECMYDNYYNESHLITYSINLKERIGESHFNALLLKAADYKANGYKWSRSELLDMIVHYKNEVENLK